MKRIYRLIPALFAILLTSNVQASIIDFESGSIDGSGVYTENGFSLSVNGYDGFNGLLTNSSNPGNSTTIFAFCTIDGGCSDGTSLSLADNSTFSISSIDAANWQPEGTTGTIDLVGHFSGGGTFTQTIITSDVWSSFSLSGLNNLVSLDIVGNSVYAVGIDNLELNAVPVPAAVWLFGSGLLALIGVARRKTVVK